MVINPYEQVSQGLGGLAQGLQAAGNRFYEADRVSQYSSGIAALDRAFTLYNQDISKKKWSAPIGSDGQLIDRTIGQIDEDMLQADHEAQVETARDIINRTTTNKQARDQLLQVLEQKSAANYGQVRAIWQTNREHEMIAESDRNIEQYRLGVEPAATRKKKIEAQLQLDVASGLRYADDAAIYQTKLFYKIDEDAVREKSMLIARSAGLDTKYAEQWIDINAKMLTPDDREKAKQRLRAECEYARSEIERATREENESRNKLWGDLVLNAGSLEISDPATYRRTLQSFLYALQSNATTSLEIGGNKVELTGDFKKDITSKQHWEYELRSRLAALEKPPKAEKSNFEDWQKDNYQYALGILSQARSNGEQPRNLKAIIDDLFIPIQYTDPATGEVYFSTRINGQQVNDLYSKFVEPGTSDDFKYAEKYINDAITKNKIDPLRAVEMRTQFFNNFRNNQDASAQDLMAAADAIVAPAVKEDLQAALRGTIVWEGIFGDQAAMDPQEKALASTWAGKYTWRLQDKKDGPYLQQLSQYWLSMMKNRFPEISFTRGEPASHGYYGAEGIPLLFDDAKNTYRVNIKGNVATLERRAETRDGKVTWEEVTAAPRASTIPQAQQAVPKEDVARLDAAAASKAKNARAFDLESRLINYRFNYKKTPRENAKDLALQLNQGAYKNDMVSLDELMAIIQADANGTLGDWQE